MSFEADLEGLVAISNDVNSLTAIEWVEGYVESDVRSYINEMQITQREIRREIVELENAIANLNRQLELRRELENVALGELVAKAASQLDLLEIETQKIIGEIRAEAAAAAALILSERPESGDE